MGDLLAIIVQHGVPVVALLVLLGQLGLPTGVSAEVMLLLTGCYAVHSLGELAGAVALVAVADLIGAAALFVAARRGGAWLAARRRASAATPSGRRPALLLLCRSLPVVRMPATVAAGLVRLPARRFLAGSSLAGLVWCGVPLTAGYLLRTDVRALADGFGAAAQALLWLLPASGVLVALARRYARRSGMSPLPAPALSRARSAGADRRAAVYGAAPVAAGSSGWLLHSFQEPV